MADLDVSALDGNEGPSDEQLREIAALATRQVASELHVEQLEAELAKAKENLRDISWNLLPDAMQACGIAEFKLESGARVTIKDEVYSSISEKNRPVALGWLREHNHGAIIKNNITVPLEPDQDSELVQFLQEHDLAFDQKQNVHNRTLQAWVKEQLRQGNEVPESISYFEQRISKVVK